MQWMSDEAYAYLTAIGKAAWADTIPDKVVAACAFFKVTPTEPLYGGLAGAVVAGVTADRQSVVLKIAMPERNAIQLPTLHAMRGPGVPEVLGTAPQYDAYLMERLPASPLPAEYPVDATALATLIRGWINIPAPQHCILAHDAIREWLDEARRGIGVPPHLTEALQWSYEQYVQLPGGDTLLHGDLTRTNLLQHEGKLYAVDPRGVRGSVAMEAGLAAVWCPKSQEESVATAIALALELDCPTHEVLTWTAIRAAHSGTNKYIRGEYADSQACYSVYREARTHLPQ
jgi:hypothetical protein